MGCSNIWGYDTYDFFFGGGGGTRFQNSKFRNPGLIPGCVQNRTNTVWTISQKLLDGLFWCIRTIVRFCKNVEIQNPELKDQPGRMPRPNQFIETQIEVFLVIRHVQ